MKAAIIKKFGNPNVFNIKEVDKPKMGKNQILIKVFIHGVNPIDWKQRKGNHKYILGSPFPIILGYDVCGEVVDVGRDVRKFKVGDIVYGVLDNKYGGALAEFAVGTEKCFNIKPADISIEEAAAFPLVSLTALQALRDKANLKPGQTVLINGASGGVGHVAVQIAKILGARVIAVSGNTSKEFVQQFNPDRYIDYTAESIFDLTERVDVVFDVAGSYDFIKCLKVLNPKGIYVNTLPRPKILLHKLVQLFTKSKKAKTLLMKHSSSDLEIISEWINNKKLTVKIDKIFNLDDIVAAHDYAQKGHSKGKNIVIISRV
ncbi:MAG: NADP-dependent oxidoreductase [Bacteroidales bacterium]|nr:NADP-dependent oxidoreductase [Bacteroidales bacterium]